MRQRCREFVSSLLLFEPWVSPYQFCYLSPGISEPFTGGGGADRQPGNTDEGSRVHSRLGKVSPSLPGLEL